MAHFLTPTGDVTNTGDGGPATNAWDTVNDDDSSFWYTDDNTSGTLEVHLSDPGASGVKTEGGTHTVRYKVGKVDGGVLDSTGNTQEITAYLYHGTTLIHTDTTRTCTGTLTQYTFAPNLTGLTEAQLDDLRLRFVSPASGGGSPSNRRGGCVSWCEAELEEDVVFQYQRPDADLTNQGWTNDTGGSSDIHDQIDETTPLDTSYIQSETDPENKVFVARLDDKGDPATGANHFLKYRYKKDTSAGNALSLTVELRELYYNEAHPGNLRGAAQTHTDIGAGWTENDYLLTTTHANAISNYSDLSLRFVANKTANTPGGPPVLESGDITESKSAVNDTTIDIDYPVYSAGTLVVFTCVTGDNTVTYTEPTAGPDGETITWLQNEVAGENYGDYSTEIWVGYYIATADEAAGYLRISASGTGDQYAATCQIFPKGTFDKDTPIGAAGYNTVDSTTSASSAAFTAGATDGGGLLVTVAMAGEEVTATPTGWTNRKSVFAEGVGGTDRGARVCTRDTLVTNSESISAATWTLAATGSGRVASYVVRPWIWKGLEAAQISTDGSNTSESPIVLNYGAYEDQDLVLFAIKVPNEDGHTIPATGPNSETIVKIFDQVGTNNKVDLSVWYYIADGDHAAGTVSITTVTSKPWAGASTIIPSGSYDSAKPIGAKTSNATTGSGANSAAFTANDDDLSGQVISVIAADSVGSITSTPTGWTELKNSSWNSTNEILEISSRDAAVTYNESIAAATWNTNETGDSVNATFVLRDPSAPSPVALTSSNFTGSGSDGNYTSHAITYPAYSTGDLVIVSHYVDNQGTVTLPAAPDGETITYLENKTAVGADGTASIWWYVATSTETSSTMTVTVATGDQFAAAVLVVPAGEFDATTPIGTGNAYKSTVYGTDSTPSSTASTAAASDVAGRLVSVLLGRYEISARPTGWTEVGSSEWDDGDHVAHIDYRDDMVNASESIASATWTVQGDGRGVLATLIIRANEEIVAPRRALVSFAEFRHPTTATAASDPTILGGAAIELGAVTLSATGVLGAGAVTGTLATDIAAITTTTNGDITVDGDLDVTLDAITTTTTGTVDVVGSLDTTLGAITTTTSGEIDVVGSLDTTLGAITLDASGTVVSPPVTGTLGITLGAITTTTDGDVDVDGDLGITLGAITTTTSGEVDVVGTLSTTLGAITTTTSGEVDVVGSLGVTLGAITTTTDGDVVTSGALDANIGVVTTTTAGEVDGVGSLDANIGAITTTTSGEVDGVGSLDITLDAITTTTDTDVVVDGDLDAGTGALTLSASGAVTTSESIGTLGTTLGAITTTTAGEVDVDGSLDVGTGAITTTTAGEVDGVGSLDVGIGAITTTTDGEVTVDGTLGATLSAITTTTSGEVDGIGSLDAGLGAITTTTAGEVDGVGSLDVGIGAITTTTDTDVVVDGDLDAGTGALTLSASGAVTTEESIGTLDVTLDAITTTTDTDVVVDGDLSVTLADITVSASGDSSMAGTLDLTVAAITLDGDGAISVSGSLNVTLDDITTTTAGGSSIIGSGDITIEPILLENIVLELLAPGTALEIATGVALLLAEADESALYASIGDITLTGSGAVDVVGALDVDLGAITTTTDGGPVATGSLDTTLSDITLSAQGNAGIAGTLGITLGAITTTTSGEVDVVGSLDAGAGALTLSASGTVTTDETFGTLGITLGAITTTTSGEVDVDGTLTSTLADIALDAQGVIGTTGVLDATLGAITLDAQGVSNIVGALSATLFDITLGAQATVDVDGTLTVTLGDLTLSATGTVVTPGATGTLSVTLGDVTLSGQGTVDVDGALSVTLGDITLSGQGVVDVDGTLDAGISDLLLDATSASRVKVFWVELTMPSGSAFNNGWLYQTLDPVTLAASGVSEVTGALDTTLGGIGLGTATEVPATGVLSTTLGAVTLDASGQVTINGTLNTTLEGISITTAGYVADYMGSADISIDPITLTGTGEITGIGSRPSGPWWLVKRRRRVTR